MLIGADLKMADVLLLNNQLVSVINRFGISLGFGDKTVRDLVEEHKLNLDFFLVILNAFHDKNFFPKKEMQLFPVEMITDYLKKTHTYYLEFKVPELERLINSMVINSYDNQSHADLLKKFFREYRTELRKHMEREDKAIFPYSMMIEKAHVEKKLPDDLRKRIEEYSMEDFASEHDNIEEKLYDLKNIIIKYLPAPKNAFLCQKVITELFMLEEDLNDHSRIEDTVLVPKVIEMEKDLFNF